MYDGRTTDGSWRPGRLSRLALGLFPGLRIMAVKSAVGGLPYLLLGLAALVLGGLLTLQWEVARQSVRTFQIREVFLLAHASAIVLAVLVYELLRFGSTLEERYYGSRAPRFLAAFLLPALALLLGGPSIVRLWPRLVEALWLTAGVIVVGALPAAVWSAAEGFLMSHERLRRFQAIVGASILLLLVIGGGALASSAALRTDVATWAANSGFVMLPRLLAG